MIKFRTYTEPDIINRRKEKKKREKLIIQSSEQ